MATFQVSPGAAPADYCLTTNFQWTDGKMKLIKVRQTHTYTKHRSQITAVKVVKRSRRLSSTVREIDKLRKSSPSSDVSPVRDSHVARADAVRPTTLATAAVAAVTTPVWMPK